MSTPSPVVLSWGGFQREIERVSQSGGHSVRHLVDGETMPVLQGSRTRWRDRSQPRRLFVPGIQFKPIPNVVLKLDYRNIDTWGNNTADEINLGFGLVF